MNPLTRSVLILCFAGFLLPVSCVRAPLKTEKVYVTRTGTRYHTGECSYLGKSKIPVTLEEALNKGYVPCKKCSPPGLEGREEKKPGTPAYSFYIKE